MTKKQMAGLGIIGVVVCLLPVFILKPQSETSSKATPARPPVVANNHALKVTPGPGPLVTQADFAPLKCVNERTGKVVFQLAKARNAKFLGQRNQRSFWKVDTPSRAVTFNTDARDVNCAFDR